MAGRVLAVRLDERLLARIDREAESCGGDRSAVVRGALERAFPDVPVRLVRPVPPMRSV